MKLKHKDLDSSFNLFVKNMPILQYHIAMFALKTYSYN